MIVERATYVDGRRVTSTEAPVPARGTGLVTAREPGLTGLDWVQLSDPTTDELEQLGTEYGVPRFALDVALRTHHRPRLERFDGHLLVVLKPAVYVDPEEVIEVGHLVLLLGAGHVLAWGTGVHGDDLVRIRTELEAAPERMRQGPAAVLHAVADHVVDGYAEVLDGLENDVDQIEAQVFAPTRGSHAERIYRLKSEVQPFRRAVVPLADELEVLVGSLPELPGADDLAARFRDVRAKAVRTAEHVVALDELLNSVLSAHLAQIGIRQNDDMRRISAWVAIVIAPTALAAIYGMNFRFMPELEWRYGYFVVLGVMAAACLVLYRLFKRSGWL